MFHIHERFLRHIWKKQYLQTLGLTTIDGRVLEIIAPGIPNTDAGPDFLDARIRIDGRTLRGDIELHQRNSDWIRHRHSHNCNYNRVILHVVLYDDHVSQPMTESGRPIPVLSLQRFLDDSFRAVWDRSIADDRAERSPALFCSDSSNPISPDEYRQWLFRLFNERMELKLRRFEGRIKELIDEQRLAIREPKMRYYGDIDELPVPNHEYTQHDFTPRWLWEQVLYEGMFEALGYSKNREPFLTLARNVRIDFLRERIASTPEDQQTVLRAILFGVAGFLPTSDTSDTSLADDDKCVVKYWRETDSYYTRERLQKSDWLFFRLRPNNFPTRRLQAGVDIVQRFLDEDLVQKIIQSVKADSTSRVHIRELRLLLTNTHRDDNSAILGRYRIDDILINVVFPLVLLYARVFKDTGIRETVHRVVEEYPSLSENSVTQYIRRSIPGLGTTLKGAQAQQGMIHLYNFYCTENRCNECVIGQNILESSGV
jgi:hypothetical protein